MVDNLSVKLISLRIEKNGRISEVSKRCEEVVKIHRELCFDIINSHNILHNEHERHERPSKANKQKIFADSP